jgi:hypothetical protein
MPLACLVLRASLFVFALFLGSGASAQGAAETTGCAESLKVTSHTRAGEVTVEVALTSRAPAPVVWAVMTDYGQAARFIRHLKRSDAVATGDHSVRVTQTGRAEWGPFGANVQTEYDVHMRPAQLTLEGRLVRGDVKDMWLHAQLVSVGTGTQLTYRNTVKPAFWMPLGLAEPMLTQRAAESFADLQAEISRRAGQCSPASAGGLS